MQAKRGELVTARGIGKTSFTIICPPADCDGLTIGLPASGLLLSILHADTERSFNILSQSTSLLCSKPSSGSHFTHPYNAGHARSAALSPPVITLILPPDPLPLLTPLLAAPTLQPWHQSIPPSDRPVATPLSPSNVPQTDLP